MKGSDRNDLCVAPRVLPVVEAMAAMVAMDFWLRVMGYGLEVGGGLVE